jgi:3-hydroxybutyryl-CoA dehydratase
MNFKVGDKASHSKIFSEEEVLAFSALSVDENPIHFDKEYATKSRFGQRIVQGPMVVSLVGGVMGTKLPGPGTIYMSQETSFKKPVFINQHLTAWVEVVNIRDDKPIVTLHTWVENKEGDIVVDGTAVIYYTGI